MRKAMRCLILSLFIVLAFASAPPPAVANHICIWVCVDGTWVGGTYQFCIAGDDLSCTECRLICPGP